MFSIDKQKLNQKIVVLTDNRTYFYRLFFLTVLRESNFKMLFQLKAKSRGIY